MKKEYKKPNICALDFEILDLILASGDWNGDHGGDDDDWGDWFDSVGPFSRNGGFKGVGF